MHDIKFIRENLDKFKKLILSRNVKVNFDDQNCGSLMNDNGKLIFGVSVLK